ncbi:hypothetical protein LZU85_20700 [Vibrio sp. IRLE0018]|nr:hypothetical protein [Vibrio floridensis]
MHPLTQRYADGENMIQLNHIGEALVCELINNSDEVRSFLKEVLALSFDEFIAVPEIRLDPCSDLIFDGVHKVDICILDVHSKTCFPIEAKLGLDRLAQKTFDDRFLHPCKTSHSGSRVSGSMISVIERQLPEQCDGHDLSVTYEGHRYLLTKEWALISRKQVHSKWEVNGFPSVSSKCRHLVFEDVARKYGNSNDFNTLVSKLLNVDFYRKWVESA